MLCLLILFPTISTIRNDMDPKLSKSKKYSCYRSSLRHRRSETEPVARSRCLRSAVRLPSSRVSDLLPLGNSQSRFCSRYCCHCFCWHGYWASRRRWIQNLSLRCSPMNRKSSSFPQQQTLLGNCSKHPASTALVHNGSMISLRIVAKDTQLKSILPLGFAMTSSGIASGFRQQRNNVPAKRYGGRRFDSDNQPGRHYIQHKVTRKKFGEDSPEGQKF